MLTHDSLQYQRMVTSLRRVKFNCIVFCKESICPTLTELSGNRTDFLMIIVSTSYYAAATAAYQLINDPGNVCFVLKK